MKRLVRRSVEIFGDAFWSSAWIVVYSASTGDADVVISGWGVLWSTDETYRVVVGV